VWSSTALQHTVHLAEKHLRKFNRNSEYNHTKVCCMK
jgi:hypothetical protein